MSREMFPRAVRRSLLLSSTLAALSLIASAPLHAQYAPLISPTNSTVVELHINGEIEPILSESLVRETDQATTAPASLSVITNNTPAGLDASMRGIIQSTLRSPVPVV